MTITKEKHVWILQALIVQRITTDAYEMMPVSSEPNPQTSLPVQTSIHLQNVHPSLAMFKHDLKTDKM